MESFKIPFYVRAALIFFAFVFNLHIGYIGSIITTVFTMIIAFVTKDSLTYPVLVLVFYIIIQFVDNNYIVPIVVASRLKINALISVIAVLVGGALRGISGMVRSIPLTAILKVFFDHINSLKLLGFLLGNIVPVSARSSHSNGTNYPHTNENS